MIAHKTGLTYPDIRTVLPPEREPHFQARVVNLAKALGWRRIYHPWTSIHSASGWPDLVLCKPPRCIYAEVKTERGRVMPAQDGWLIDLAACPGHEVPFCERHNELGIWRPSDWRDIVRILQA